MILWRALAAAVCTVAGGATAPLPHSTLAVRDGGAWREWWRSETAAASYTASRATLAARVRWLPAARGVEWGELQLSGTGEAWRTRLVVARIDPTRVRFTLDTMFADGRAAWTIGNARSSAVLAVNAGQFHATLPWGWVVLDGREFLSPGSGPLASAVTIGDDGRIAFTHGRAPPLAGVRWAFQSYPTLVAGDSIPAVLRSGGCALDVAHRDARLALGLDREGRVLIAMTRFDGLGGALDRAPFGLTTPEMAAVMGSLGASDAVSLDGGISAQLMLRTIDATVRRWPGIRAVPLALVVLPWDGVRH